MKNKMLIKNAFDKFDEASKNGKDKVGVSFKDGNNTIAIPKSLIDLVMDLNPKDDTKRAAITEELFKS